MKENSMIMSVISCTMWKIGHVAKYPYYLAQAVREWVQTTPKFRMSSVPSFIKSFNEDWLSLLSEG